MACLARFASFGLASLLALGFVGCAFEEEEEESDGQTLAVRGGSTANAFPEAVLIDYANGSGCSGSMIAPRVVLTAGHCAVALTGPFQVYAPFANGQRASGTRAAVYDYPANNPPSVPRRVHDVGLLFLDTPIELGSYPKLGTWKLDDKDKVVIVGRVQNGNYSSNALYRETVKVKDGETLGYRFSYNAENVIQSGDSGGPDFLPGTHTVVAVNSAGGGVIARVDLLTNWIQNQVAPYGGFGKGGGLAKKKRR